MVHIIYDVNSPVGYYSVQSGSGTQFFESMRNQRGFNRALYGRGVLGVVTKIWNYMKPYITPLAKEAFHALTDEGLDAGQKLLSAIAKGKDPKEAIITQGTTSLKNLTKRAGTKLTQAGSGKKRKTKIKTVKPNSIDNLRYVGETVSKSSIPKNIRKKNLGLFI